jgi:gliding motility-associated-like protein
VKEDLNIDKLFKSKFENFEGNVDPSVWANISQGIVATGGASTTVGLSGLAKVAIIVGAAAITSFSVWYFTTNSSNDSIQEIVETDNLETTPTKADNSVEVLHYTEENSTNVADNNNQSVEVVNNVNEIQDNSETKDDIVVDNVTSDNTIVSANVMGNGDDLNVDNENPGNTTLLTDKPEVEESVEILPDDGKPLIGWSPEYEVDGGDVYLISNAKNHAYVTWELENGETLEGDEVSIEFKKPGVYRIKALVYGNGDPEESILEVEIKGTSELSKVPNVFSPNGDNDNDYIFIKSKDLDEFMIIIYDKNMNEIFRSFDPNFEWNGEGKDGSIKAGKYYYMINALGKDGQTFKDKGSITLSL